MIKLDEASLESWDPYPNGRHGKLAAGRYDNLVIDNLFRIGTDLLGFAVRMDD